MAHLLPPCYHVPLNERLRCQYAFIVADCPLYATTDNLAEYAVGNVGGVTAAPTATARMATTAAV